MASKLKKYDQTFGQVEPEHSKPRYALLLAGVIAPLALFGTIAEDVAEKEKFAFDNALLYIAREWSSETMDRLMAAITYAGSGIVLAILCALAVFVLLRKRESVAASYIATCFVGAAMLNQLCKHLFARARPDLWVSALPETSFSFPSGHAMNSMALFAALVVVSHPGKRRTMILAFGAVFVALVGASRLYWGVHYPSDILAGWACAIAWICLVKCLFEVHSTSKAPFWSER